MKTPRKQKIDKVLVPLDFSRASLKAIDYALALGGRFGAKLHFVHVLDYDYPPPTLAMMGVVIPDAETGRNAKRRLKDIAKKYAVDLPAENLNVVTGRAYHEICQLARQLEVDLIAISTRGHTGLKHLFLGSTAERVVQHATCPVLVVRERERDFLRGDEKSNRGIQLKKILAPLDFSACSLVGVEFAVRFASHWDAQLVLFHAVPIHAFVPYGDYGGRELPDITGYAQDVAKQEMEQLISRLRTRIKVEAAVELGSAAQEVCDYAREHDVDLIITSTHGSTGLKHVLIGSIAEHIVRYAYCPMEYVHMVLKYTMLRDVAVIRRSSCVESKARKSKSMNESDERIIAPDRAKFEADVAAHPFLIGMSAHHIRLLADCAMRSHFEAGHIIFREGETANRFYLIEHGKVALESSTLGEPVKIEEIGDGDLLGWSWLFPPYAWHFTSRALVHTTAIFFYGTVLREYSEQDHSLGFELFKRMSAVMLRRLQAARQELLNVRQSR